MNFKKFKPELKCQSKGDTSVKKKLKGWHIAVIVISAFLVIGIIGTALGNNNNDTHDNTLTSSIPETSENITTTTQEDPVEVINVTGLTAYEAEKLLEDAGFTNLKFEADESGESKSILNKSDWTVTKQDPPKSTVILSDKEIILTCKKTEEIEQEKLEQISKEFKKLVDKPVTDAISEIKKLGYSATYLDSDKNTDYTNELSSYSNDDLSEWLVTNIDSIDLQNMTVIIYVKPVEKIEETTQKPTVKQKVTSSSSSSTSSKSSSSTSSLTSSSSSSKSSNNNFQTYDNEEQQNTTEYVLNTNTKKVHRASCHHVKKISPNNYSTISSLEDAYAQGYEACKVCKP